MDWPLSRQEKTRQVMNLYDKNEQMTDSMLVSGGAALAKLKAELEMIKSGSRSDLGHREGLSEDTHRVWQAVEAAQAVFRAVVPTSCEDDCSDDDDEHCESGRRSKSAGALRSIPDAAPPKVAPKPRTPRSSLTGKQRRVSFGEQPQEAKKAEVEQPPAPKKAEVDLMPSLAQCDHLSDAETAEPEPEESLRCRGDSPTKASPLRHGESPCAVDMANALCSGPGHMMRSPRAQVTEIRDWGLTEFCVPVGTPKVGLHFKRFPPEPLNVLKVTKGSWADKQGICVGDVVTAIGGKHADRMGPEQFVRLMQCTRPLKIIVDRLPK